MGFWRITAVWDGANKIVGSHWCCVGACFACFAKHKYKHHVVIQQRLSVFASMLASWRHKFYREGAVSAAQTQPMEEETVLEIKFPHQWFILYAVGSCLYWGTSFLLLAKLFLNLSLSNPYFEIWRKCSSKKPVESAPAKQANTMEFRVTQRLSNAGHWHERPWRQSSSTSLVVKTFLRNGLLEGWHLFKHHKKVHASQQCSPRASPGCRYYHFHYFIELDVWACKWHFFYIYTHLVPSVLAAFRVFSVLRRRRIYSIAVLWTPYGTWSPVPKDAVSQSWWSFIFSYFFRFWWNLWMWKILEKIGDKKQLEAGANRYQQVENVRRWVM